MPDIKTLLCLQWLFALLAVGFLIASGISAQVSGVPLSAAPVLPAMALFVLYAASLRLPAIGRVGLYRLAMIPALVFFGGGGVIGNIAKFAEDGLDSYASMPVFVIAVGINAFGTILNVIAALGLFKKDGGS